MMARRMKEPAFRADQWARRYRPPVAKLNRFVDELGKHDGADHPPYIAPMYRGVEARALSILRDPGPKAGGAKGSGFLCVENDDATAERMLQFLECAGINVAEVVPWNVYPWYINKKPTTAQLKAGTEPLLRVIEMMRELRVVLLHGRDAERGWQFFLSRHQKLVNDRGIQWFWTYHTSRQALQHPDPAERDRREEHIRDALRRAAVIVGHRDQDSRP